MHLTRYLIALAFSAGMVCLAALPAQANEGKPGVAKSAEVVKKNLTIDQLPPVVKETLNEQLGANKLISLEQVTHGKMTKYVATWKSEDRTFHLAINADGKIIRAKTLLKAEQLPAAVNAALAKEAGTNKISEIEEIPHGKLPLYESEWKADGKWVQARFDSEGKLIRKRMEVALDKLPSDVKNVIEKEVGAGKLDRIVEFSHSGKTLYVAWYNVGDIRNAVRVDNQGKLIEKGTLVAFDKLPAPVRDTFLKEAGQYAVLGVCNVTRGQKTFYLGWYYMNGDKAALRVDIDGKVLGKDVGMGWF
ncbi:MAG: hypothetical protein ACE15C_03360 [Phycisphaerae bacterium]